MNDLLQNVDNNLIDLSNDNRNELVSLETFNDINNKPNNVMLEGKIELGINKYKENVSKEIYDFSKVKKPFREELIIPLSELVLVQDD